MLLFNFCLNLDLRLYLCLFGCCFLVSFSLFLWISDGTLGTFAAGRCFWCSSVGMLVDAAGRCFWRSSVKMLGDAPFNLLFLYIT